MNWKQLKDFCNSLDEKQLEKKVILWQEESAINKIEPMKLEEDHYTESTEPELGCFPLSDTNTPIEELELVYGKGHPILYEMF